MIIIFFSGCRIRHSTDREVALMMLLAYLSYMLAEVQQQILNIFLLHFSKDKMKTWNIFFSFAAIPLELYLDCVLLWDYYVSLHMAQCYR